MIDKGFFSFLCSLGSLITTIVVYAGLVLGKKRVTVLGMGIGGATLLLCALFFIIYF